MARWGSWGAIPGIFDSTQPQWSTQREQLRELLTGDEYAAASRTTLNAHYTSPEIAAGLWQAVTRLGFTDGNVLEPGCGSGVFMGTAPAGAHMTGIELDPITAAIAAHLHPAHTVVAQSFADTRVPAGSFDVAIGNVPFGDVQLHDPAHNPTNESLHNHFIIKALALTKPGGVAAFITSRFTMDTRNKQARLLMAERADFLGAVRLPTGAHRRSAGTDALTDVMVFRVREEGRAPAQAAWTSTRARVVDGHEIRVNEYFEDHPEMVLGTLHVGHGMHGEATATVTADPGTHTPAALTAALHKITDDARAAGLIHSPAPASAPVQVTSEREHAALVRWEGSLHASEDGTISRYSAGSLEPVETSVALARELRSLIQLRDATTDLLTLEAKTVGDDHPAVQQQRRHLEALFDAHVAKYGCPSRVSVSVRENPRDPESPIVTRRIPRASRIFRTDPHAQTVFALATFDAATESFTKATILHERVVQERVRPQGADTASDAIALSLDTRGRIDLPYIAALLDIDEDTALTEIGDQAFLDPDTGQLEPASAYLSGNVRLKLAAAQEAATRAPDTYQRNIEALSKVQPVPLAAGEIEAKIGAVWIPADVLQDFTRQLVGDSRATVKTAGSGIWEVRLSAAGRDSVLASGVWGTERMHAGKLIERIARQQQITVYTPGSEPRMVDAEGTAAALAKADEIRERFSEWVWEDPERSVRLQKIYNEAFNSLVLRTFETEAAALTLPGLTRTFTPREHQKIAVARMLHEQAVGLFHEVGAGKTAEMVMGAMELRRLGMVNKPLIVVPNHMLEQFSREWLGLYPAARILAASSQDLTSIEDRRAFVAGASVNDWDGIIMTQGAFKRLSLSADAEEAYMRHEIDALRLTIERTRQAGIGTTQSIKNAEKTLQKREEKLKATIAGIDRDPGLTFEQTGIDYLIVDEAHHYKNLATPSAVPGAAIAGSDRATDLHMKIEWLRENKGKVATFATGTPVSNSITETFVMQRYLRPDILTDAGIEVFDQWVATFGTQVTEMEIAPQGGYKLNTRLSSFQNVPELLAMWSMFADTKTAEDMQLPRPDFAPGPDGERAAMNVLIPASRELHNYMVHLTRRVDAIASRLVDPSEDNMLKVTTDGRKAACDMRMIGQTTTSPTKADYVIDKVTRIWQATKDRPYINPTTGEPSTTTGATQLIFCDYSTPTGAGWNIYEEIRSGLINAGMPPGEIAFIHSANTDAKKRACSRHCVRGASKSCSGRPIKWAPAPTSKTASSPCTTSTAPGVQQTSPSVMAVPSGNSTRTPKWPCSGT